MQTFRPRPLCDAVVLNLKSSMKQQGLQHLQDNINPSLNTKLEAPASKQHRQPKLKSSAKQLHLWENNGVTPMQHYRLQHLWNIVSRGSNATTMAVAWMQHCRPLPLRDIVDVAWTICKKEMAMAWMQNCWPGHLWDAVGHGSNHLQNNNNRSIYEITMSALRDVINRGLNTTLSAAAST